MAESTTGSQRQQVPALLLAASMALGAIALWAGVLEGSDRVPLPVVLPWFGLAVLFYAAEAHVAHMHFGGDAHSFSLSEIALVLALLSLPPAGVVSAALAGGGLALLLGRRQRFVKMVFNLAYFALAATVASALFTAMLPAGSETASPRSWAAALIAVLPVSLLGLVLIEAVIALSQRRVRKDVGRVVLFGMTAAAANTSVGLAAAVILSVEPAAAWTLLVPAAVLLLAYRAYVAESQKRQGVEFLYEASEILSRERHAEDAVPALLAHTGEAFRAGLAELTVFPRHAADVALRAWWWPQGGASGLTPLPADPADMVTACVVADGGGLLMRRCASRQAQPLRPTGRMVNDAIVVALESERGPIGTLLLANRLGDVTTFSADEVRLLETLARQLGAALERGELERSVAVLREGQRQLRHQALHDPLTGMANRSLFTDRLGHALSRRTREPVAVLFVDLDGFKNVNDTFGHASGDEVLETVSRRIVGCLRPSDTAARLGGDEFAVLVEHASAHESHSVARRLLDAVRAPVELSGGRAVAVDASVGVAFGVAGGLSPEALLRRADAAMYRAKAAGKGTIELDTVPDTAADGGVALVGGLQ